MSACRSSPAMLRGFWDLNPFGPFTSRARISASLSEEKAVFRTLRRHAADAQCWTDKVAGKPVVALAPQSGDHLGGPIDRFSELDSAEFGPRTPGQDED